METVEESRKDFARKVIASIHEGVSSGELKVESLGIEKHSDEIEKEGYVSNVANGMRTYTITLDGYPKGKCP